MNKKWRTEYIGGTYPKGVHGILVLSDGNLELYPLDATGDARPIARFFVADTLEMHRVKGGGLIEFASSQGSVPDQLLIDGEGSFQELQAYIQSMRPGKKLGVRYSGWVPLIVLALIIPVLLLTISKELERFSGLVPLSVDTQIGETFAGQFTQFASECDDPALNDAVATMYQTLVAAGDMRFSHEVSILAADMTNAFALPGGKIVILSGLLSASESAEEVAGILAHEIGHVELRHGVRQIMKTSGLLFISSFTYGAGAEGLVNAGSVLVFASYSRDHERESDTYAVNLLHSAGLSSIGMGNFFERQIEEFERLKERGKAVDIPPWLSTHPTHAERVEALRSGSGQTGAKIIDTTKWLRIKDNCSPNAS